MPLLRTHSPALRLCNSTETRIKIASDTKSMIMLCYGRASRGIPLPLPSLLVADLGKAGRASTRLRAHPVRLPHLAPQQQRYKTSITPHNIPILSSSLTIHQHKQQQQLFKNNPTSPHPRSITTQHHTHTLSTHQLYQTPEINIMGIEIPTEQWAQVVDKVGAGK